MIPARAMAWPLVGRDDELEWVATAGRDRSCCGVVLSGLAGVGKSRLAREAIAAASGGGSATEWVQATQAAAAIPLGAFAGLLPTDVRRADSLQLFQLLSDSLGGRSTGRRRVVLAVDDGHLLDPHSAALVFHLASNGIAFVIVTVRSGERCPDSIVALWKDLEAPRLEVQQLSEAETGSLVRRALGDELAPSVVRWAFDLSEGHPLYLRELVKGALASGDLAREDGRWVLRKRPTASPALVELISGALAELDRDELDAARLLALGEPLELKMVSQLVPTATLNSLEARGLAVVTAGGAHDVRGVRLSHPLYGEVVRDGMPEMRGSELRLLLANAVQAQGLRRPGDALRVVRWLDDARAEVDADVLLAAAHDGLASGAPDLAEQLARRAGTRGPEASLVLGISYALRRRFEEAEDVLAPVEGQLETPELAIAYLEWRALRTLHFGLLRSEGALELARRAEAWFPGDAWHGRVDVIRQQVLMSSWGPGTLEALESLGAVLERDDLIPEVRRRAANTYVLTLYFVGRTNEAHAISRELLPSLPLRDGDDCYAVTAWCIVRQEAGYDWDLLERWCLDAERTTARRADPLTRGEILVWLACDAFRRGKLLRAARAAREAIELLESWDEMRRLPLAWLALGMSGALRGDVAAARAALDGYDRAIGDAPIPYLWRQELSVRAMTLAIAGETGRAATMLLEGATAGAGQPIEQIHLLHEAFRAGAEPSAVADGLARIMESCDAPLGSIFARLAHAQAASDGEALVAAAEALGNLGAYPWAAEAAALAAVAHDKAGREDSSRRALALSSNYLGECEDFRSPILASVALAPAALTPREREIVMLAAKGATNAEIAERLVLSVRTVESHLYRAMQKLGIGSRQELEAG